MHLFYLTSIPSEFSILSEYNVFILFVIHAGIYLKKRAHDICYFHKKIALATIIMTGISIVLFQGNSSSE